MAGSTYSADFPVTSGKLQTEYAGPSRMSSTSFGVQPGGDVFLLKLHGPSGLLIHSTLYGTAEPELVQDLHIDRGGRAYVAVALQGLMLGARPTQLASINEEADALIYSLPAPSGSWVHSVSNDGRLAVLTAQTTEALCSWSMEGTATLSNRPFPFPIQDRHDPCCKLPADRFGC